MVREANDFKLQYQTTLVSVLRTHLDDSIINIFFIAKSSSKDLGRKSRKRNQSTYDTRIYLETA